MNLKRKMNRFAILILAAGFFVSAANGQQQPSSAKAVQLMGLAGVKHNTPGKLAVENGNLRFVHSNASTDLPANSVQDVVTGSDSQRVIRGTLGTLSMFGPYGSDRFMSLFRTKLDTLTIQFRDADGGLHGVVFTMPVGTAEVKKNELIALGAHTSIPNQGSPSADSPNTPGVKEAAVPAQERKPEKKNASAIVVMMIQSDEIKLPAEFQIALYENLIEQLQKNSGFQHIYREGDQKSAGDPNVVILHSTVRGFKQGSEMARQVTTVAGETSIHVHCEFTDNSGKLLLARDIEGKVRFFGANLRATLDFAKKAASVTQENFSPAAGS